MSKPWETEPNHVEWYENGYHCVIRRTEQMGHLCGYVGVPKGHPMYGIYYGQLDRIECHYGLTYSGHGFSRNYWYLGFDCAHLGDLVPSFLTMWSEIPTLQAIYSKFDDSNSYKDIEYVKNSIKGMIPQLKAVENAKFVIRLKGGVVFA